MKKYRNVNWYCDECGDLLDDQSGFTDRCGIWVCQCCGYENCIDEDEIYDSEEEFQAANSEGLSVYDAALICLSNGMDEDYTFGYSEEELKESLRR